MHGVCHMCTSDGVPNICKAKNLLSRFRKEVCRKDMCMQLMDKGGALGMRLMTKVKTIKILIPRSPSHGLGTRLGNENQASNKYTGCMQ